MAMIYDESIYTNGSVFTCNLFNEIPCSLLNGEGAVPITVYNKSDEWLLSRLGIPSTRELSDIALNTIITKSKYNIYTIEKYRGYDYETGLINRIQQIDVVGSDVVDNEPNKRATISFQEPDEEYIYTEIDPTLNDTERYILIKFYVSNAKITISSDLYSRLIHLIPQYWFKQSNTPGYIQDSGYLIDLITGEKRTLNNQTPKKYSTEAVIL